MPSVQRLSEASIDDETFKEQQDTGGLYVGEGRLM